MPCVDAQRVAREEDTAVGTLHWTKRCHIESDMCIRFDLGISHWSTPLPLGHPPSAGPTANMSMMEI
eukprot:scaffold8166_cov376-Prasinococcus_capsulatus_cf.AAC.8